MNRRLIIVGTIVCLAGVALLAACSSGGNPSAPDSGNSAPTQSSADSFAVALPTYPEKLTEEDSEAWIKTLDENPLDPAYLESLSAFSYKTASAVLGGSGEGSQGGTSGADATEKVSGAEGMSGADEAGAAAAPEAVNSTYSPISLYYALALATQGAAGQTADEMNAVLGAPDPAAIPLESGNLFRVLARDPFSTVDLANSIWMSEGDEFEQGFVDTATQGFYATPFSVAFGTAETDQAIADWIYAQTNGTIEADVQTDGQQLMSIINAIYFKATWSNQFDAANTQEATFHAKEGDVQADFMTQRLDRPREYVQTDTYTRASLDFVGGTTMSFVLPSEGVTPEEILADQAKLTEAFTKQADDYANITYTIPKTEFASTFDLIDPMKSLGMTKAFSDQADFSNLTPTPAFISTIKQESFITWDENGAEASAYTSIGIETMSAMPEEVKEVAFTLDRPFLFQITSSQGVPLFIGMCGNPVA